MRLKYTVTFEEVLTEEPGRPFPKGNRELLVKTTNEHWERRNKPHYLQSFLNNAFLANEEKIKVTVEDVTPEKGDNSCTKEQKIIKEKNTWMTLKKMSTL